jgi:UDP-N-acetylmuramyl tripeptide synthase
MTPGIIAALGPTALTEPAVLEVDERWVGSVLDATGAQTLLLLNLSRDQLDRSQEVRKLAQHWKTAIGQALPGCVIANADDPLVVWAAVDAPDVTWVATGQDWTSDAAGCPACSGRIEFDRSSWHCTGCDLQRPTPDIVWDDSTITIDDRTIDLELGLPGRANRANAAFAIAAACRLGAQPEAAARAVETVTEVAGRYRVASLDGVSIRLLLAKNPAGWHEALEHLAPRPAPVIVAINARIADGHDPSWLWDVDFERLDGRFVVALGERRHDLAVRLHYADVEHVIAETLDEALLLVAGSPHHDPERAVDIAANYTAFQEYLDRVGGPE